MAAAYGLALGAFLIQSDSKEKLLTDLDAVSQMLAATRPTAVNLFWALERMKLVAQQYLDVAEIKAVLRQASQDIREEINDDGDLETENKIKIGDVSQEEVLKEISKDFPDIAAKNNIAPAETKKPVKKAPKKTRKKTRKRKRRRK